MLSLQEPYRVVIKESEIVDNADEICKDRYVKWIKGELSETSYVKLSEISEKGIKDVKKKWGQKGADTFEKAMNKGIVGPEGQSGIK